MADARGTDGPKRWQTLLALGLGLAVIGSLVAAGSGAVAAQADPDDNGTVSEAAYVDPAPEKGDPYFEAAADDGSWVSYENPRDEYRSPYLGDGSGKVCVSLVNENGEPVIGESVPNTSVTVPTGGATTWHSDADPMTVQFPMDDHYEFPLDGDQFGTSPDVAQGDGYMDSHCLEFHGNPEDATLTYGEAEISGEYADRIDVAGYIQQEPAGDGWDTDIDPVAAAESYEEAGGSWTYNAAENSTHGQVVVVLQLDAPADERFDPDNSSDPPNGSDPASDGETGDDNGDAESNDRMPGFGVVSALVALSVAVLARRRG
ncbi:PGF-CTERM sorting domain-containing protein [Natrinema thermotolerans]|uniref:PGF-CTERM sorting domain-containing protein n=1 Tax=Natrinema thermotolerans TaxID=121872 RepID=A0AAF0PA99_9EURY|nr:PGF-CTERM sorting domain-containing protein [Natrinema thermotolerans]QCC59833.1 PGF-CTERM sorting domain-containing protein [Natrinema thermotolerans]WMT06824.1 PGF-CTERM sorting domain-containing protein [Natrinema thermotolerans]